MKYFSFLLIVFCFCCLECDNSTFQNSELQPDITNEYSSYKVVMIGGHDIDYYFNIESWSDYPKEFKIKKVDSLYRGTVTLIKTGIIPIDSITSNESGFIIITNGKLGPVEQMIFIIKKFTKDSLNGDFFPIGKTVDVSPSPFLSKKIN
jgi:hypothetical protein